MDPNIDADRTREFHQNLGLHCDHPVKNFILALVQRSEDQEILYCIARILYMLSRDAAMDAVVPFVCHNLLKTCIRDVHLNTVDVQSMEKLKHDGGIDIVKSLELCIKHECIPLVTEFWEYLRKKVEQIHKDNNRPAPSAARIPNTYDPSSGSAYYFSEHGEKSAKCQSTEYQVGKQQPTMMNNHLWMMFATKNFPEHILQVLDIYSCGFVLSMGMHMDVISEGPLCLSVQVLGNTTKRCIL